MRFIVPLVTAFALTAPAFADQPAQPCAASAPCYTKYAAALDHARRAQDRARDEFRNPAGTMEFFHVEPGMTVVDYMPSSGWYTRVLVPYLGEGGRYIGVNPDPTGTSERFAAYVGGLRDKFPAEAAKWNLEGASVEAYNTNELPESMNGTVDRVLIFREMHNLHRNGVMHGELTRMRELLKDGGMLGIVQHRAKPDASADYVSGIRGYMREKDVIGLVEAHGFELVGKSEVNANPRDTADHPQGVWELPPSLRTEREELKKIGESDRMTLLFRKRA